MNEETTIPAETEIDYDFESFPPEDQETIAPDDNWTVEPTVMETVPEATYVYDLYADETYEMTTDPVLINVITGAAEELAHVNLFGSFLICGTLVGLFILRKIYGT